MDRSWLNHRIRRFLGLPVLAAPENSRPIGQATLCIAIVGDDEIELVAGNVGQFVRRIEEHAKCTGCRHVVFIFDLDLYRELRRERECNPREN